MTKQQFPGIPTWSVTSIIVAALITGMAWSVHNHALGLGFTICFALAALICTMIVELRGLFLTVVQLPLLFALATPVSQWLVMNANAPKDTPKDFSSTALLTAVYPVAKLFPVLLAVTLGCFVLAITRLAMAKRTVPAAPTPPVSRTRPNSPRPRRARVEGANHQLTVDELMQRRRQQRTQVRQEQRPKRPTRVHLDDDLYS